MGAPFLIVQGELGVVRPTVLSALLFVRGLGYGAGL